VDPEDGESAEKAFSGDEVGSFALSSFVRHVRLMTDEKICVV